MQIAIAIVLLIISYAITALTAKGPPKPPPPNPFKDFKFPVPDEGTPQQVVFGDVWLTDWQVLWVGGYHTAQIHVGGGGKKG